ncbi:MAG: hypothetical protein AAGE52_05490 [Myxococcota bacterium]
MSLCDDVRDALELGEKLSETLSAHAAGCEVCQATLQEFAALDAALEGMAPLSVPEPLLAETLARAEALREEPTTASLFGAAFSSLGSGVVSFGRLLAWPFRSKGPRLALLVGVPSLAAVGLVFMTLGDAVGDKVMLANGSIASNEDDLPVMDPPMEPMDSVDLLTEIPAQAGEMEGEANRPWAYEQTINGLPQGQLAPNEPSTVEESVVMEIEGVGDEWTEGRDGVPGLGLHGNGESRGEPPAFHRQLARLGYVQERAQDDDEYRGDRDRTLGGRSDALTTRDGRFDDGEDGSEAAARLRPATPPPVNARISGRQGRDEDRRSIELDGDLGGDVSGGDTSAFATSVTVPELDQGAQVFRSLHPGETTGLTFQSPTGLWANTYLPGDPRWRLTHRALRAQGGQALSLAEQVQPHDPHLAAPRREALGLTVRTSRARVEDTSRVLLQVGIRGAAVRAGRRPKLRSMVVLDLRQSLSDAQATRVRGLLEALSRQRTGADRIGLVVAGPAGGTYLEPGTFRFGEVTVALRRALEGNGGQGLALPQAMTEAIRAVGQSEELGTGAVWLVSPSISEADARALDSAVHTGALGGVTTTAIGVGSVNDALEKIAFSGHGRRWLLEDDARSLVRSEVEAVSRTVARAIRLNVALGRGVQLVDVLGSRPLGGQEAARVRAAERSIDQQLARQLGIASDRDDDDEGIQIVIPSFLAGDSHTVLLDLVVAGPGPVADVTVRYKDLLRLNNGNASARVELPRGVDTEGPTQREVLRDYLAVRLSDALRRAASQGDPRPSIAAARREIERAQHSVRALAHDAQLVRFRELCTRFEGAAQDASFRNSLLYASHRLISGASTP